MSRLELDPALNLPPLQVETVHLIGICGTAMAALAGMLVEKGYRVTGSDANVYPPMSDFLAGLGIKPALGYAAPNLDYLPDLAIVGNVVTRENPEAIRLKELGLPYLSLPQALRHFFMAGRKSIVVAGTHGKTTASSLLAWLLHTHGLDPGFMIGGILKNFDRNFRLGSGEWFVVEGDEYDTAFFDKVPKFIHYAPYIGILTSVEFDHADIYPDLAAVISAFRRFVELIPSDGLLIAWGDHPRVRQLAEQAVSPVIYYGLGPENDWRAINIRPDGPWTGFDLLRPDHEPITLRSPMPGRHNVLNTVAALAALDRIGLKAEGLGAALTGFQGVKRRQEVRGVAAGVTVIDDFAHHPTAVSETLAAIRGSYNGARLVAVFEPRSNTSRRNIFQEDYVQAFDLADEIIIRRPPNMANIPLDERFSSERLVADLRLRRANAHVFPDTEQILDYLRSRLCPGDVVLIMSNGGFDRIHERLLAALAER